MTLIKQNCPLCNSASELYFTGKYQKHHICPLCKGIFVDYKDRLPPEEEEKRYKEHNNDVNDIGYQNFVSPITNAVLSEKKTSDKGLDFGAGTGPVISKILKDNNYNILQYDPFFHNYPELLNQKYDYIACCEVIEHFNNPKKEFALLKSLLNNNAGLYCMTSLYSENICFKSWYYKNDPTHVFIYQEQTMHYIKDIFKFKNLRISNNLIIFDS